MNFLKYKYEVKRNEIGFLIKNNVIIEKWNAGFYYIWNFREKIELITLSTLERMINVVNQEVLTSDNIAFRFSFNIIYKVVDGELFLNTFDVVENMNTNHKFYEAELRISTITQAIIKNKIASFDSEELNEKRYEISDLKTDELIKTCLLFGIEIISVQIKDITFPKMIQELFAKQLEAKIRTKTDLENARTAVATARTLKNAADLMKENEYIKFIKYMETMVKIAEKGRNTFVIGDVSKINY